MKNLIIPIIVTLLISTSASAEKFSYIVPAGPDGGTAKWAQNVVKHWNKQLKKQGHEITLRYIKKNRGKKAYSEFATTYNGNQKVMIQGNGLIEFLTKKKGWKGFDPRNYEAIGGQTSGAYVFAKKDLPKIPAVNIGGGAETILDAMSMVLMKCGPMSLENLLKCQKEKFRFVKGWKNSSARRKAYLSGSIQLTRDGFSHMRKTYKDELKSGKTIVWYSHENFNNVYKEKWGTLPSGKYYDVYLQTAKMRSILGKYIMINKNNSHYSILVKTFEEMLKDKKSKKALTKKLGKGRWLVGSKLQKETEVLWSSINKTFIKEIISIRNTFK